MDVRRISPALTQNAKLGVVSVEDVKAHARISHSEEDFLIASFIEAAYDRLAGPEGWLGHCALLREQYEVYVGLPRPYGIELPMRPYYEHADSPLTFDYWGGEDYGPVDAGFYYISPGSTFPLIARTRPVSWPYYGTPYSRAYRIRFWAGFGASTDVPMPLKMAIRMLVTHWFENRGTVGTVGDEIKWGLRSLCGGYRVALDHS